MLKIPLTPTLLLFLATVCSSAGAQDAPIQAGHQRLVAMKLGQGLVNLNFTGSPVQSGHFLPDPGWAVAYDRSTDTIFAIDKSLGGASPWLYALNPHRLSTQQIGSLGLSSGNGSLACHPVTGDLYLLRYNGYMTLLYSVNKQTGVATYSGSTLLLDPFTGLSFHPQTHELYASSGGSWTPPHLYKLDPVTGYWTHRVATPLFAGIAFDSNGILYAIQSGSLVTVDLVTGQTTFVCASGYFSGLDFVNSSNVPLWISPSNPLGGQPVTITVTGAQANASTWMTWSLVGTGSTVVPQLGVTLGIASPISHSQAVLSKQDGHHSFTGTLPNQSGLHVWVQAAQVNIVSEVITFTIQ